MPAAPQHRDRRGGLILFGVVLIVTGCICGLFVPLLVAGRIVMPQAAPDAGSVREVIPGALAYAALAILFVWLGVGSIRARRWAPPLILTVGWLWLITGVIGVGMMAMLLPSVFAMAESQGEPLPAAVKTILTAVMLAISSVVLVVLPAAVVLFYRSRHVQATCDARDPVPRWTDGRPASLLGLSLSLGLLAASLLPTALVSNGVALCFGVILTGVPGIIVNVVFAAFWGCCAWSTYRCELRGWWATAISVSLASISALVTVARVDPSDLTRLMGSLGEQVGGLDTLGPAPLAAFIVVAWLSVIGSLLHVRKHFRAAADV